MTLSVFSLKFSLNIQMRLFQNTFHFWFNIQNTTFLYIRFSLLLPFFIFLLSWALLDSFFALLNQNESSFIFSLNTMLHAHKKKFYFAKLARKFFSIHCYNISHAICWIWKQNNVEWMLIASFARGKKREMKTQSQYQFHTKSI